MFKASLFTFGTTTLLAAGSASAAVVYGTGVTGTLTEVNSADTVAYSADVSSIDILNGIAPTAFDANWFTTSGRTPAKLTDGLHGAGGEVGALAQPEDPPAVVVFNLGTGDNGLGYDFSSIVSIASWTNNGFGNQHYTLEVAGVGADGSLTSTDFTTLLNVNYQARGGAGGSTKVTIKDLSGTLTSGIQYIRFTGEFSSSGSSGRATYRELDIFGTSTVPEPGSLALLGLGGLCLLRRRRNA